ncbi:hypothetical protein AGMMS49944_10400 [Spirochaetia bacterium]|nr:hypothetical protein AGMMS49944_10400 [Spirochaetia bacterium]
MIFFKLIGVALVVALNAFGWRTMFGTVNEFIYSQARSRTAVEQVQQVAKRKVATVTTDALNMREKPSAKETLIRTLHKGERLIISGEVQNGWVPVEIDGKRGFVSDSYISIEEE